MENGKCLFSSSYSCPRRYACERILWCCRSEMRFRTRNHSLNYFMEIKHGTRKARSPNWNKYAITAEISSLFHVTNVESYFCFLSTDKKHIFKNMCTIDCQKVLRSAMCKNSGSVFTGWCDLWIEVGRLSVNFLIAICDYLIFTFLCFVTGWSDVNLSSLFSAVCLN